MGGKFTGVLVFNTIKRDSVNFLWRLSVIIKLSHTAKKFSTSSLRFLGIAVVSAHGFYAGGSSC